MKKPSSLTIAMAASEALPYAKSGGLADVVGALAAHLGRLGHRVLLFVPYYRVSRARFPHLTRALAPIDLPFPGHDIRIELLRHEPSPGVSAFLVREDAAFDRPYLYGTPDADYWDNAGRFAHFCRAVLAGLLGLRERPDLFHVHDWQAALLPLYLRHRPDFAGALAGTPALITVHNLAYQGLCPRSALAYLGIPEGLFTLHGVEFYGRLNVLKGGLVCADAISTVSPRYGEEIRTPEFGEGLDGVLRERAAALSGILNGVDYQAWNPETDERIAARYGAADLAGKARCKEALERACGFEPAAGVPLFGTISRMADQKGFDLLAAALPQLAALPLRWCLLGSGDRRYQDLFLELARRHPERIAVRIGYDEDLAHRIEAGADCYLMPSRFEPCGLNQLYSLRYGTIPVVRAVGGLADTVRHFDAVRGSGTGFVFRDYDVNGLLWAVREALAAYARPAAWARLRANAMAEDFSWESSARRYVELYRSLAARRP
ncbi:MAG TPA: glycogen synthase GlgA [Candidatus Methanoperedens sp.]|nr:glycogen synthase GlgA [Candidatus Methanoperedens sp.]